MLITSVRIPLGRVHGFETALNWNGENRNKNEYEYFETPKYNEKMAS